MVHQIVRRVRSVGEAVFCALFHALCIELHGPEHPCKQRQAALRRVNGIEYQLFVLLHILIICKGNAFHRGQQGHERPVDSSCLAPHQLRDIRVFLLRHDAASRAVRVVDLHELILIGVPDNNLLRKTAQVHHHRGHCREQLDQVVPVGHGIHAVQRRSVKSEELRRVLSVKGIGRPCKGARSKRAEVHPFINVPHPLPVPLEHLKIGPHVVRQCDRLRLLEMGESRHKCLCIFFHQCQEHFQQLS